MPCAHAWSEPPRRCLRALAAAIVVGCFSPAALAQNAVVEVAEPPSAEGRARSRLAGPEIFALVVGSSRTPTAEHEPLAWVDEDARAWALALGALAPADHVEALPTEPTSIQFAEAIVRLAQKIRASARPSLVLITLLGRGRPAAGSTEFAFADRWLSSSELSELLGALGADRFLVVADFDGAVRWLWPRTNGNASWTPTSELAAASMDGSPVFAVVETRRRTEIPALHGSLISLRTRTCLLGLADLDRDGALKASELARCVLALPTTEASIALAVKDEERPLWLRWPRRGPGLALPAASAQLVWAGTGELIAAARIEPGHGGELRLPPGLARAVIEVDEASTPSLARALTPVGPSLLAGAEVPRDLWGMSLAAERELDSRLRLAGFYDARQASSENTLWLAGGVTAGAIGLGLLVAEVGFEGPIALDVVGNGISPVLLAGGAATFFGAAMSIGALVAPLFSDPPGQRPGPPPGRQRRRAIAHALDTLQADASSDERWRLIGGGAAAGMSGLVGIGSGALTALLLADVIGGDENTRRLLSLGAGTAAGAALGLAAVAVLLPLTTGRAARLVEALDGETAESSEAALPAQEATLPNSVQR